MRPGAGAQNLVLFGLRSYPGQMNAHLLTILCCDDTPEPDRSRHGDSDERLARHLQRAADLAGLSIEPRILDVRQGALPDDDDASELFVTTGSALAPFDDVPWVHAMARWLPPALARGARVYAICFGHQLVAHALGGQTRRAPLGWELGCVPLVKRFFLPIGGARLGQPAFPLPPADARAEDVRMLMSHRDEVSALPPGALPWLEGAGRPSQGFVIPGQAVTVQGHPEYEPAQAADGYTRRQAAHGPALQAQAMASLVEPDDGLAISAEVLSYFLGGGD